MSSGIWLDRDEKYRAEYITRCGKIARFLYYTSPRFVFEVEGMDNNIMVYGNGSFDSTGETEYELDIIGKI